jgi:hypothetical protein
MVRKVFCLVTALFVVSSSFAYAQDTSRERPTQTDMNVLTDARIGILKAALQLTPEQAKYWPALEEALRARAQERYQRITATGERLAQGREVDSIELLRGRADALTQRAVAQKNLLTRGNRSTRVSLPTRSSGSASSYCVSSL